MDKHYVTITLPEYPNADLGGVYRLKEACADENGDGKCDRCGNAMAAAVPTRKADYPAESSGTVQTGMAYLLRDLQAGKIFEPVEGQTLNYRNYYLSAPRTAARAGARGPASVMRSLERPPSRSPKTRPVHTSTASMPRTTACISPPTRGR